MSSLDRVQLNLVETLDEANEFMRWLGERRPVLGFDTETTGLEWWYDRLRLVQFGDAETGWAIPYGDWRGLIHEALDKYDRPLVAHNLPFDAKFCIRNGLPIKRELWHDTLPMTHLMDPPGRHDLKGVTTAVIDPNAHAGQAALDYGMQQNGWNWATVPINYSPYWKYSALDPVLAARLFEHYWPDISSMFPVPYELEIASIWDHVDAAMRGLRVDIAYAREEQQRLREQADQIRENVDRLYGLRISSNEQVTARLIEDGIKLTDQTPSGKWKLDKDILESLRGEHPIVDEMIRYKQSLKFATAYYGGVIDRSTTEDGIDIIHADINTLGARTSRMSVSKPALQQIPSKDPRPRRMFIPRPKRVQLSGDLSNIEPRIMAHYSQEPTMMQAFIDGVDVHTLMARHMYPAETSPFPDDKSMEDNPYRKKSKSGSLGKMYGIGIDKFSKQQGVSPEEAAAFMRYYDETFPAIPRFISDVELLAEERYQNEGLAYITSPDGRRHPLTAEEARWGRYYALVNFVIQGYAAALLKRAITRFTATEFGEFYVLPVHDELILDVPEEIAEEAGEVLRECLITCDDGELSVPLAADIAIYKESWAESADKNAPSYLPRKKD